MSTELIPTNILPENFKPFRAANNLSAAPIYKVAMGLVILTVYETPETIYAHFSNLDASPFSAFDITTQYQKDALTTLRMLLTKAFCLHYELATDEELFIDGWNAETITLEHFIRDVADVIPDALQKEDLIKDINACGEARGIYYFVIQETPVQPGAAKATEPDTQPTFCLVELEVSMPDYTDDEGDATAHLWVAPRLDAAEKDRLITERRQRYLQEFMFDPNDLFANFGDELVNLLSQNLTQPDLLPLTKRLALESPEWWYNTTLAALRGACPNLTTVAIETDGGLDDCGNAYTCVSEITFTGADNQQYVFQMDYEGFGSDDELLDEEGELGGDTYEKALAILGPDFTENGVFELIESLSVLMMRRNATELAINPRAEVAA